MQRFLKYRLPWQATLLVIELGIIFFSIGGSSRRIQTGLAVFTTLNLLLLCIPLLYFTGYWQTATTRKGVVLRKGHGAVANVVGILFIFAVGIAWPIMMFPYLVNVGLRHFGDATNAQIVKYQLGSYTWRSADYGLSDLSVDDARFIVVTLRYGNTTTQVKINNGQPAFAEVYRAAISHKRVGVRYSPILPQLARTNYELCKTQE